MNLELRDDLEERHRTEKAEAPPPDVLDYYMFLSFFLLVVVCSFIPFITGDLTDPLAYLLIYLLTKIKELYGNALLQDSHRLTR